MKVENYKTAGGKDYIGDYIEQLSGMEKARAKTIIKKLEDEGLEALNYMNTRQLDGKLYEIKFDKNRFMYVIVSCDLMYIVHACRKQKNKAEDFELDKAKARAKKLGIC